MDHARPHFLHGNALEFVRSMGYSLPLEPGQCAATQLLGTLGCDVNEKKAAGNGCGSFTLGDFGRSVVLVILLNHDLSAYLKRCESATGRAQESSRGAKYKGRR